MKGKFTKKAIAASMALVVAAASVAALPAEKVSAKQDVTSISLNVGTKATVYVGKTKTIKVTKVNGAAATSANKAVTFKSSKKKVATVSNKGVVKGVKKGSAVIKVTSKYNKNASVSVKVSVKQYAKKIRITNAIEKTLVVRKGKTQKIKTKVLPKNADKQLKFKSKRPKKFTVTKKGKLKGKKYGKAKVSIKAVIGPKTKAARLIRVIVPKVEIKSIVSKARSATITPGATTKIVNTITPSNATCKLVGYKSSNPAVATVGKKGKVTAKAPGKTTITVTTLDGRLKSNVVVTVAAKAAASVQTPTEYTYKFDKYAKSYDVSYQGLTLNVLKEDLVSDLQTAAKMLAQKDLTPAKFVSQFNIADFKIAQKNSVVLSKLVGLEGTGPSRNAIIKMGGKEYRYTVTGTDTALTVKGKVSTSVVDNVKITETADSYIIKGDSATKTYEIKVAKDYSGISVTRDIGDTRSEIFHEKIVDGGVEVTIEKAFYNEMEAKYPTTFIVGFLDALTISNVY